MIPLSLFPFLLPCLWTVPEMVPRWRNFWDFLNLWYFRHVSGEVAPRPTLLPTPRFIWTPSLLLSLLFHVICRVTSSLLSRTLLPLQLKLSFVPHLIGLQDSSSCPSLRTSLSCSGLCSGWHSSPRGLTFLTRFDFFFELEDKFFVRKEPRKECKHTLYTIHPCMHAPYILYTRECTHHIYYTPVYARTLTHPLRPPWHVIHTYTCILHHHSQSFSWSVFLIFLPFGYVLRSSCSLHKPS